MKTLTFKGSIATFLVVGALGGYGYLCSLAITNAHAQAVSAGGGCSSNCTFGGSSGSNAISFSTSGARLDLGGGASDYLDSDGTRIRTGGELNVQGLLYAQDFQRSGTSTFTITGTPNDNASAIAISLKSYFTLTNAAGKLFEASNNGTQRMYVDLNGAVRPNVGDPARPACSSAERGKIWFDEGAAGVLDSLSVCRKDAADVYAWATLF
jgi:hypothetical protein